MTSTFPWQNFIHLFHASFHTPRPNLPVTPGVSWLPTFVFHSPIIKRTSFGVLVLEGLVGLHRTLQLQLLQWYCLLTWITEMLNGLPWKQTEIILSFLRLPPSTNILASFVDYEDYSISSKGFLPMVADIMVIWVKFTHSSPFSSLIPMVEVMKLVATSFKRSHARTATLSAPTL